MASPRCAHLLLAVTILLQLFYLARAMPLPSPSPASDTASSLSSPPAPPVPALPRGLPRIIPAWSLPAVNPFTAKAAFIRYWNRKVRSNRPHPAFFFAKLSPLSAPDAAAFSTLASAGKLASRIRDFCAAASLLCPSVPAASCYESGGNVGTSSFTSYTTGAIGDAGEFASYAGGTNTAAATFATYDSGGNTRAHEFSAYAQDANSDVGSFISYDKGANAAAESFKTYGNNSNTVASWFVNYGEKANGINNTFASYGAGRNAPENTFRSYASGSNAVVNEFKGYRDGANIGDDSFTSYATNANGVEAGFDSYGKSTSPGSVSFKGYGQGANPNHRIGFTHYSGDNTTFKAYSNEGVEFKEYQNMSKMEVSKTAAEHGHGHWQPPKWSPEPGKFFRERGSGGARRRRRVAGERGCRHGRPTGAAPGAGLAGVGWGDASDDEQQPTAGGGAAVGVSNAGLGPLADSSQGTGRSTARGGWHACRVGAVQRRAGHGDAAGAVAECASAASRRDDEAVSDVGGGRGGLRGGDAGERRRRGAEHGVDGGRRRGRRLRRIAGSGVTRSVSCHQSLFPYLVYYCHSVPRVRLYEADILDVESSGRSTTAWPSATSTRPTGAPTMARSPR
ncbi:unnamed protein product [Urochloa decumbens]|uniref:BURP domain-containing protein n=1 Tax=Urochloa decumbens TaxID=240449 RepID=A0ABC9G6C1_9POAL